MRIPSVSVSNLTRHQDDRGSLYEVVHAYDIEKFGQTYVVADWDAGVIRGFHRHERMWDYFHIVKGSAMFILVYQPDLQVVGDPNRDRVETAFPEPVIEKYVLSEYNPQLLTVPPTIWHGWMSLGKETVMISTASEVYNRDAPDEERIPFDTFGEDVWTIKPR